MTSLGLQVIQARDQLKGHACQRYKTVNAQAQRGFIKLAQELGEDDLHVHMPDAVKRSGWRRQFKDHDKIKMRLMTGAEGAERNVNQREKAANKEANAKAAEATEAAEADEEDIEEEAVGDPFLPLPSTAPAAIQTSRAGRKRAPTTKALEAEKAPKRGTGQGVRQGPRRQRRQGIGSKLQHHVLYIHLLFRK
jgi:hypothetical protein